MMTHFGHAAVVLALLAGTSSANAQYYRDYDARYYRDYDARVVTQPVPLTQAQRTTIYRTIIPQGRGRGPIVREQIVTEPVAPMVRWMLTLTAMRMSRAISNGMDMAWSRMLTAPMPMWLAGACRSRRGSPRCRRQPWRKCRRSARTDT